MRSSDEKYARKILEDTKNTQERKIKKSFTGPYESEGRGFESLPAHQGHLHLQVTFFVYYSQVSPANQVPRQLQTAGAFLITYYLRLFQAVPKPTTPAQSSAASASSGKASPVRGRAPTGRAVFFMGRGIGAALGAGVAVAAGAGGS